MDQELQRNPMKSSDSRMNSKYKSPYGCRTNSHCVKNISLARKLKFDDGWQIFVFLTGQYKMQTADCRLQTADRVQNAD